MKKKMGRPTAAEARERARLRFEADVLSGKDIRQTKAHTGEVFMGPAPATVYSEVLRSIRDREKREHLEAQRTEAEKPAGVPLANNRDLARFLAQAVLDESFAPELRQAAALLIADVPHRNAPGPADQAPAQLAPARSTTDAETESEKPDWKLPEGMKTPPGCKRAVFLEMVCDPQPGRRYVVNPDTMAYCRYWPPAGTWHHDLPYAATWFVYDNGGARVRRTPDAYTAAETCARVPITRAQQSMDDWEAATRGMDLASAQPDQLATVKKARAHAAGRAPGRPRGGF